MKRRNEYVVLFTVPALLAAAIVALLVTGAVAGGLWLFVYGDNPWPSSASTALTVLFMLVAVAVWMGLLFVAHRIGRKQEGRAVASLGPVIAAVGATAVLGLLIALQQWCVGNLGPKSVEVLCSEFCREKGSSASGTPPRDSGESSCSCFDARGREAVKVPIDQVTAHKSER